MFSNQARARAAWSHKWMGLLLTVPLLGWVVSSAALIVATFNVPNGLQGVYRLQPYNSIDVRLESSAVTPTMLLRRLGAEYGLDRIHWLRLEARGPHLWYVVRPTPSSLAMTFDARSGRRLDPLPDDLLAVVADEALVGTRVDRLEAIPEFNRDYLVDRVPAVAATMVGEQPSLLILSRDSGRTLRRTDADAGRFHWWYKYFHVNQYTDHVLPWTALLYTCVLGVIALVVLGYLLFVWRVRRLPPATPPIEDRLTARNVHRKVGVAVGGVLVVQLLAGTYIWLSLGPLNDAFRGKPSLARHWSAGIPTHHELAPPEVVLARVAAALTDAPRPVQAVEWRKLLTRDVWLVTTRRDELPHVFDATTGMRMDALHPDIAGEIARQETAGSPAFDYLGPLHFESMDLNRRQPAYRFRFRDAAATDVYVLQRTGDVIMRRPAFWRVFGPFLSTHMLAVSRNKVLDVVLLGLFQTSLLVLIISGWRIQFPGRRRRGREGVRRTVNAEGRARAPLTIEGSPAQGKGEAATHATSVGGASQPTAPLPRRRELSHSTADCVACASGLTVALLLLGFFVWRMEANTSRDRAVGPVPVSTPTPALRP